VDTITLKEENRGLTLVNHRPQNPIFTQKKFWCAKAPN